jgi:hypothetical protein
VAFLQSIAHETGAREAARQVTVYASDVSERDRLAFALDHLRSSDWEAFEALCSEYHAVDFPDLRTIAGTGDMGRDAILRSPSHAGVVLQFSIEEDWKGKIDSTIRRVDEAGHQFNLLIYVTNRRVGPKGDQYVLELVAKGHHVDIRDREYFLDRVYLSQAYTRAAEQLSRRIITPLLPGDEIVKNSTVSDPQLRAGLLYLELQLHDADSRRNLTKLTFDALTLAALRDTDGDSFRGRGEIVATVQAQMPEHEPSQVAASVNGSLERLQNGRRIVFKGANDAYALHHGERVRQVDRTVEIAAERAAVREQLTAQVDESARVLGISLPKGSDAILDAIDETFQAVLEQVGNEFAEGVRTGDGGLRHGDIYPVASTVGVRRSRPFRALGLTPRQLSELMTDVVAHALIRPSGALQQYLRQLADAYTLLAFTRSATDVQAAVGHFFSKGKLVLDASVLLPLFAETTVPEEDRRYTNLFAAAREAGMTLHVTEAVLNEIETHFGRCMYCISRAPGEWIGDEPFVLQHWRALAGGDGSFRDFAQQFRERLGDVDSIEQFLADEVGAVRTDMHDAVERFPAMTRHELTEVWRPLKHHPPHRSDVERDMLLSHDVEMYIGVLGMRKDEAREVFGYEAWWVTIDGSAYRVGKVAKEQGVQLPSRPCMSPGFLSSALAFGPAKSKLGLEQRLQLPVALEIQRFGWGSPELTTVADRIREENAGKPEWLIRNKARKAVNKVKSEARDRQLTLESLLETP